MTSLDDEILIGEGVRLGTGSAPLTLRVASGFIDAVVLYFLAFALSSLVGSLTASVNDAAAAAITVIFLVVVFIGIPATVETLTRGLSLGRAAVGLRIVRDDGGPISFRHAFTRAALGLFEVYLTGGSVAVTVAMVSRRGKRIGDHLAGTYALRTRGGTRALPPVLMPPQLVAWASTADMRRLPDGLALTARLFLGRAYGLRPQARARLGTLLAEEMSHLVAPPPPAGTHPEAFIAAVLATRRDREYAMTMKQTERSMVESDLLRRLPHGVPESVN